MGEGVINFYKTKVKKSWKIAFLSTFIIGLLTHIYKFTNTLLNHDSLFNFYSDQNIIGSGRWFLSFACQFSSYFDLPWLIGLISIILIALTVVVIVDIFNIGNPIMIFITGGLLATFPAITETFFFEFTADGYMLAMLLAALAVRFSLINDNRISHIFIAAVCICLSCAIYQAYVSFALVLAICYFICELLENRHNNKEVMRWIGNQAIIYVGGLATYYIIWQIVMKVLGYVPSSYEGISTIGQMNIHNINGAIFYSVRSFIQYFVEWNIFEHGVTAFSALNVLFLIFSFIIGVIALKKSKIYKKKLQAILLIAAVGAIPFVVFMWYFASSGVHYSTRMEQSICVLFIFVGVVFSRWAKPKFSTLAGCLLVAIVLNNCVTANVFYFYVNKANTASYATAVEMSTRVHLLDNGKIKNIAVIGSMDKYDDEFYMESNGLRQLGGLRSVNRNLLNSDFYTALYLKNMLDFQLSYYSDNPEISVPYVEKNENDPVADDWKLQFPLCDKDTRDKLKDSTTVSEMPCWPASDSIKVIDDTVVIKLSEPVSQTDKTN